MPSFNWNDENLDLFWHWIAERQKAFHNRRVLRRPPPWTDDPIIATNHFTNEELDWAINFNERYVETYSDPSAAVNFDGEWVCVGELPDKLVQRRIRLAQEALEALRKNREYRKALQSQTTIEFSYEQAKRDSMAQVKVETAVDAFDKMAASLADAAQAADRVANMLRRTTRA